MASTIPVDFSYVLNSLNAMICITDSVTDELLFINDSMRRVFNPPEDCVGKKCYRVLRGFDSRCPFCPCYKLDTEPDKEFTWEQESIIGGKSRTYRYISKYIDWPGGRTVHIQNAIDITDIKETEQKVAENNELNRTVFENAPIGLTMFDENYKFIDCNDNCLKMFGGITKKYYSEFFGSEAHSPEYQPDGSKSQLKARNIIKHVIQSGETYKTEFVHNIPGGGLLPVDLTLTRIKRDDKYIGLAYIYDMREQAILKDRLRKALAEAESASKAKSDFLAKMSHEIRTPMNAILGITEIQMRSSGLSKDTEEALGKIYESGSMLMGIINDILDLSKIEADKLEIIPVIYDVLSVVNDTAQLNRMRGSSEQIDFDIMLDGNTPQHVIGDELRIKQILNNILSNAFKYTEKGRVEFSVFSEPISPDDDSGGSPDNDVMLVFRVSDTGRGMSKEQIKLLFTDYMRFNLESGRSASGTGLGLGITKRLTDMMGGELAVESKLNGGSVFTVRIPQKRHGTAICGTELSHRLRNTRFYSPALAKKTQFIREYMPYGSVLVVDDVESNVYVTKGMLLPYGLAIDTASSGFEALEYVKKGKIYDVIFMDQMMPEMDGIETTGKLRAMGCESTIVALTANAVIGQSDILLNSGFDAFLSKPIDSRELNHILNEFIRNKKPKEIVEAARKEHALNQAKSSQRSKQIKRVRQAEKKDTRYSLSNIMKSAEMRRLLMRDAQRALDTLDELYPRLCAFDAAAGDADLESYVITVHGMKGALANIGETEMASAALKLELAGKDCDLEVISDETPVFIDALMSMINELKAAEDASVAAASAQVKVSESDMKLLEEKLHDIKTACEAYDVAKARSALGELTQKTWSKQTVDALEQLGTDLLHSDFDEAIKTADKCMATVAS